MNTGVRQQFSAKLSFLGKFQSIFSVTKVFGRLKLQQIALAFCLMWGVSMTGYSQATITYPIASEDVVACQGPSELNVRVRFDINTADNPSVIINLPPGITYVPGSLVQNSGPVSIAEGILSNLNEPDFTITPTDVNAGDFVDFTIRREGGCEAVLLGDGGRKDTVMVMTDVGSSVEDDPNVNSYSFLSAALSIAYKNGPLSRDTILDNIPQSICRVVELRQGGLGFVDSVEYFVVVGGAIENYELNYNGSPLVGMMSNDTIFYTLNETDYPGIFGGDGMFSNGEIVDLEECFDVVDCAQAGNTSEHNARWGCNDEICQSASPVLGSVSVIVSQPTVIAGILQSRNAPACLDGETLDTVRHFIENTGSVTALVGFQFDFGFGPLGANPSNPRAVWDTAGVQIIYNGIDSSRSPDFTFTSGSCGAGTSLGDVSVAGYTGFILEPGDRIELTAGYAYCCLDGCNVLENWPNPNLTVEARDACGANPQNIVSRNGPTYGKSGGNVVISGPASAGDGETFETCFLYPTLAGYPNAAGDNTFNVEIDMQPGFAATGNVTVMDRNGNMVPSSNSGAGSNPFLVTINQDDYIGREIEFCVEMNLTCGAPGTFNFPVDLYQIVSPTCAVPCTLDLTCSLFPITALCPGPCPEGGGVVDRTRTERINVGLEDLDDDRLWDSDDPANPADVRLDRATPCDTIRTFAELGVSDGTNGPTWSGGKFRQEMIWPFFTALGANVEIFDNGALVASGMVPVSFIQGDTIFEYDVASILPGGFSFDDQDSVYMEVDYYFDPMLAVGDMYDYTLSFRGITDLCVENQDIRNTFILSNDDFVASNDACNFTIDRVQLIPVGQQFYSNSTFSVTGCDEYRVEWIMNSQRGCVTGNNVLDYFPNEFRPMFAFETFNIAKVEGTVFQRLVYSYGDINYNIPLIMEDMDSLYFDFRSMYSDLGGPIPLREANANQSINAFFLPACDADIDGGILRYSATRVFSDLACDTTYTVGNYRAGTEYTPTGQFSFVQSPLSENAFTENTCYNLTATNTGVGADFDVPYTWIEFISPSSEISVTSIRENGGAPISLSPSGVYELGDHTNNSPENIEICVQQSTCIADSFLVIYGWNCEGYPADTIDVGGCNFDTLVYFVNPQNAQIQLQILDQPAPTDTLELCTTETIEVLVNSALEADLVNPALDVLLPSGLTINSLDAGYPNDGSITFEAIPSTLVDDTLRFDLTAHSRVMGDSLPGTFSNPTVPNRQMILRFEIETECGLQGGETSIDFIGRANSPCGDPAIGDGVSQPTNLLTILGATPPYTALPIMTTDPIIEGCSDVLDVNIMFSLFGETSAGVDSAEVRVPSGIDYAPGSLVCNSANMADCPSYAFTRVDDSGNNVIVFAYPAGINDGDIVDFNFGLVSDGSSTCGDSIDIDFRNVVTLPPLVCLGVPCPENTKSTAGSAEARFTVQYSEITQLDGTACEDVSGVYNITGGVVIDSAELLVGDTLFFGIYCPSSPNVLLGSSFVEGPAAVGDTLDFMFDVPSNCGSDAELILRFSANENCICEDEEFRIPIL
ncbi:MAG: hypothetical protein GVY20_05365, partial [Bacteroidetes bacterium]|nr:hypothetical protein [Bacteroidota bacterium]